MKKKGAVELSISTIVIIVLAMSMLILGLVLVKNIFSGATYNVGQMNDKVKDQINKLFVEDQRALVYLPNSVASIPPGEQWGVAFAISNNIAAQKFKWSVIVMDDNVNGKCGVTDVQAEKWITTGKTGSVSIASSQKYYDTVRFNIPEGQVSDVSTCIVRFHLVITKEDGSPYATIPFDVSLS